MDSHVKDIARAVTRASDEERIVFPDVVKMLIEAGVERYHADLPAGAKTYYMSDGSFEVVRCHAVVGAASEFSAEGVEQAVRAVQRGEIKYRVFCDRIAAAGCVGYFVSLVGKRAVYYGRAVDTHVEWFPGARP
jgi:uncharacterized protein YbcV (DUF1398 family)